MVRRIQRANARQRTAAGKAAEKSIAKEVKRIADEKLAKSIQEFAVLSMNNLAKAGPAWTGEFSQSWVFVAAGEPAQSLTAGATLGIGKYNKNDVPLQKIKGYLKNKVERFQVVNTSEHAAIAIDEQEALFAPPPDQLDPIGKVKQYGTGRPSQEHLRWQIRDIASAPDDDVTSQITAEKDWFTNYLKGGQLQKDLNDGVKLGFNSNSL